VAERWRDALDLIDVRALSQWARRWLDTAVGSHEVLSVLVEACAGNVARNRALERLADGWLGTDVRPQARVTVDQLVSALDAAVAVAITTRSHDTTTDTTTTGPKPGSYEPGEDDL
jgi:hypothetical protein